MWRLSFFILTGSLISCSAIFPSLESSRGDAPDVSQSIVAISGDLQSGIIMQTLPSPLVIEVQNHDGSPAANAQVEWDLGDCDGSLSVSISTTDSQGRAQSDLTLPDAATSCLVTAKIFGTDIGVQFVETADWDPTEPEVKVSDSHYGQPGAVGDGVTDDAAAIQRALNFAVSLGRARVVFEANRVYFLHSRYSGYGHLGINNYGAPVAVSLVGNGATLVSDLDGAHVIQGLRNWQGTPSNPVRITDLTLASTHGITLAETGGLLINSYDTLYGVQNWRISRNTFKNFSRQLVIQGTKNIIIRKNHFYMDSGADNGSSDGNGVYGSPNVGLWMFSTGNTGAGLTSFTTDTQIYENTYDGCRLAQDRMDTQNRACGDGFVFGASLNADIHHNTIKNFSYEGIYHHKVFYPEEVTLVGSNIRDNFLESNKGGGGWGIRSDQDHSIIENNTIVGATYGILVGGYAVWDPSTSPGPGDTPHVVLVSNVQVLNNQISTRARDASTYGIQISLASNSLVKGNNIQLASATNASTFWGIYSVGTYDDQGTLHMQGGLRFEDNNISMSGPLTLGASSMGFWGQYIDTDAVIQNNTFSDMTTGMYLFFDYPHTDLEVLSSNSIVRSTYPIRR
jgi:hypothetical protein